MGERSDHFPVIAFFPIDQGKFGKSMRVFEKKLPSTPTGFNPDNS
jgi:hypothetical protein